MPSEAATNQIPVCWNAFANFHRVSAQYRTGGSPGTSTEKLAIPPSSTGRGGQYDSTHLVCVIRVDSATRRSCLTKCWGVQLEPAQYVNEKYSSNDDNTKPRIKSETSTTHMTFWFKSSKRKHERERGRTYSKGNERNVKQGKSITRILPTQE